MMLWKVKRKYISKLKSLAYLNNTIYPWTCLRDQTWRPRRLEEVQEEDTSGGHFVLLVHYKLCFLHAHLWYKVRKVPMNKENKHVFLKNDWLGKYFEVQGNIRSTRGLQWCGCRVKNVARPFKFTKIYVGDLFR